MYIYIFSHITTFCYFILKYLILNHVQNRAFLYVKETRLRTSSLLFIYFFGSKKRRIIIISINYYANQMTNQKPRKVSI